MKITDIIKEQMGYIKIHGIYQYLTDEEHELYKQIRKNNGILKNDLEEYEENLANKMVSKGLLLRRLNNSNKIYFKTDGELVNNQLCESAIPDKKIEDLLKVDNKK